MADTSGSWVSNVLDTASFCFILVAIEEFGRSVAHAGPTMLWEAQLCFLFGGITLSFLGKKGPKMWHGLLGWFVTRMPSKALTAALAENADLRLQLAERPVIASLIGPKLNIHRAVYGLPTVEDIDVSEKLRSAVGNALAIRVDNDLVPRDPAKQLTKRLEVEYSYGTDVIRKVSRPEYELLVLPEDPWLSREVQSLRDKLAILEQRAVELKSTPVPRLVIQSAHYGKLPAHSEDVTVAVQSQLKHNKIDMVVATTLFNFPLSAALGMMQTLTSGPMLLKVVYSLGEIRDLVIVRSEGERIELPE